MVGPILIGLPLLDICCYKVRLNEATFILGKELGPAQRKR